jgi:HEAT repeat protein
MMPRTLTLLLALALGASAALAADHRLVDAWEQGPDRAAHIEALVADTQLSDAALAQAMTSADWRVRQQAAVVHGWRHHPDLYASFATRQAAPTRAGMLRFRGADLADARLAPLFLERLLQQPSTDHQAALIEVLPRTGGDWAEAYVALIPQQADQQLRAMMVASMRYAPKAQALEGIRLGLDDGDAYLRGEAARAAGWSEHGEGLAPELMRALADLDPYVRAMAARSLGTHRVAQAFEALVPLLGDSDAEVRLRAMRSMARIDAEAMAARPELTDLAQDPDERVSRAAQSLR